MKKLRLFILTIIMLFTVLQVNILAEGEDKTSLPDVTVFATKKQMMDGTFATSSLGEDIGNPIRNNVGKIIFGKTPEGILQEWYVLVQDSGIKDDKGETIDNTVIFQCQSFNLKARYGETPDYKNSEVRFQANNFINDNNYFSSNERNLLNETPVSDGIKDKLYALAVDEKTTVIKAGSDNQVNIAMDIYWNSGESFWLRYPPNDSLFYADVVNGASQASDSDENTLRYASNLNLTNVLFASAAEDGSLGLLNKEDPMLLRFDGSNKEIGNISYDNENIYVSSDGECTLIVQGRNGEQNWYYTFLLTKNNFKIGKNDIIRDLKINTSNPVNLADIDLSKCKIWIERKSDGLIYAVEAKKAINSVSISISNPVPGKSLAEEINKSTEDVNYTASPIKWDTADETAGYNKVYKASVTLTPKTGYVFVDLKTAGGLIKTSAFVNGFDATSVTKNADGTLTVAYEFDPTAQDKFDSIPAISMEVESADDIKTEKFPKEADVIGKSGIVYKVRVMEWKKDSVNPLKYQGILAQLPEALKHNFNDAPATVELLITIKPAEVVQTPPPVKNNGYYIPDTAVR